MRPSTLLSYILTLLVCLFTLLPCVYVNTFVPPQYAVRTLPSVLKPWLASLRLHRLKIHRNLQSEISNAKTLAPSEKLNDCKNHCLHPALYAFGARAAKYYDTTLSSQRKWRPRRRQPTVLQAVASSLGLRLFLDGVNSFPISNWVHSTPTPSTPLPAVYALISASHETLYIGFTNDLDHTLQQCLANLPKGTFSFVRAKAFDSYDFETLRRTRDAWIYELPSAPVGNRADDALFGSLQLSSPCAQTDASARDGCAEVTKSSSEATPAYTMVLHEADDATRNKQLAQKSAFVSGKTPFSQATAKTACATKRVLPFTFAQVNTQLDEIRPYLIADGGNVALVAVHPINQTVEVALQGKCGDCPVSTVTLKMGIEKVLKEAWPSVTLKEVKDTTLLPTSTDTAVTAEIVQAILSQFIWGIRQIGGHLEIANVTNGILSVKYRGPDADKVTEGLKAILEERLSQYALKRIEFV